MTGPGGRGVPLLSQWPEVAPVGPGANPGRIKASPSRAVTTPWRIGKRRLEHAARVVRTRTDNLRFLAPVCTRPAAGKKDNVIGIVGSRIADATSIGASEWVHVFSGANGNKILSGPGRTTGGTART